MSKNRKGKGRTSKWTDELIEKMLKLWEQGMSANEIARELGHGLSRNAVIGKIHRLRAAGKAPARRDGEVPQTRAAQPRQAPRPETGKVADTPAGPAVSGNQALAMQARPAEAPLAETAAESQLKVAAAEEGLVKDIMDLKHHSCRWPIGTPGEESFSYCGRRAADGGPYCRHHASIAYTSATGSSHKRAVGS